MDRPASIITPPTASRSRKMLALVLIALGWLSLLAAILAGGYYGWRLRLDLWDQTRTVRFRSDIENGYNLGREVMKLTNGQPNATHVLVLAENGFTANLPLSDVDRDDVIFAHQADGRDLDPEHGWPLRLVVPHLYFWKSAKWVRGLELLAKDRPGFWEELGYHNLGDPWREQRYWGD